MVVYEDIRSCYPLSVEFAPYGFSPTGVGNGEVQAVFGQIVPEAAGNDVSQRIGEVMGYHLRLSGGSAGEVHQGDVVVGVRVLRLYKRSGGFDTFVEVLESFRHFGTYTDEMLHRRRIGHGGGDMVGNDRFAGADYHFDVGGIATVNDVLLRQQVRGGDNYGTELVQRNNAVPELETALQYQHHHVAMTDAEALEIRGGHVGIAFHVGEAELPVLFFIVGP